MQEQMKLKTKEVFGYALIPATTMGMTVVNMFISGYWTDVVGISAAAVGMILLCSRIFDGVSDVVMGAVIDKTDTRYGKAKPWLLAGAAGLMLISTLIFRTPEMAMTGKIAYAAILYILIFAVFGTMTGVATPTLVNLITTDTDERFRLGSWLFAMMFFVNMVLSFGMNLIQAMGGGQAGYSNFALFCCVLSALVMVYCWFHIKERNISVNTKKKEKVSVREFLATIFANKYFLAVTGIYFLNNVSSGVIVGSTYYYVAYIMNNFDAFAILNVASYLPCIIGTIIGPAIGKKIGVCRLVITGNIVTAAAYLAILLNPADMVHVCVCMAIGSFANGPACAVLSPFNAMAADYGEYKFGVARPAVYSAGTSVGTKIGVGLGGVAFSFVLAATGFDGMMEVQPASALTGITIGYVVTPAIAMILFSLLVIPFIRLEKEYPSISEALNKRRTEAADQK